jgi:Domain of unknown function (DUF4157)
MSNRAGLINKKQETGKDLSCSQNFINNHPGNQSSVLNPNLHRQRNIGNRLMQQIGESNQNQANAASPGQPLSRSVRSYFEPRFGYDLGHVKVHTSSESAQLNQGLNAHAFTYGNNIYFNQGKYDPGTSSGKHLLAHELTHVIQQGRGATSPNTLQRQVKKNDDDKSTQQSSTDFRLTNYFPWKEGTKLNIDLLVLKTTGELVKRDTVSDQVGLKVAVPLVLDMALVTDEETGQQTLNPVPHLDFGNLSRVPLGVPKEDLPAIDIAVDENGRVTISGLLIRSTLSGIEIGEEINFDLPFNFGTINDFLPIATITGWQLLTAGQVNDEGFLVSPDKSIAAVNNILPFMQGTEINVELSFENISEHIDRILGQIFGDDSESVADYIKNMIKTIVKSGIESKIEEMKTKFKISDFEQSFTVGPSQAGQKGMALSGDVDVEIELSALGEDKLSANIKTLGKEIMTGKEIDFTLEDGGMEIQLPDPINQSVRFVPGEHEMQVMKYLQVGSISPHTGEQFPGLAPWEKFITMPKWGTGLPRFTSLLPLGGLRVDSANRTISRSIFKEFIGGKIPSYTLEDRVLNEAMRYLSIQTGVRVADLPNGTWVTPTISLDAGVPLEHGTYFVNLGLGLPIGLDQFMLDSSSAVEFSFYADVAFADPTNTWSPLIRYEAGTGNAPHAGFLMFNMQFDENEIVE